MPAFQPPRITRAKNKAWTKVAKDEFRDPEVLWTDYWRRFNTVSIPIQDEDAFFADAVAAAQTAESREHLEELLEQKSRDRRVELDDVVYSIAVAAISLRAPFPAPAARAAVLKAGQTGSLDSFVQLACGVIFGWGDARRETQLSRLGPRGSCGSGVEEDRQTHINSNAPDAVPEDMHEDTDDSTPEDVHDSTQEDTHEDNHAYTYEDTHKDTHKYSYDATGNPWHLENALPSDLYEVYEAGVE